MAELVITAVGPDRPGLVGALSEPLFAAGVNIADSRMVNLRGQFALLMLVEGSDAALAAAREQLPPLAAGLGMTVTFAGRTLAAPPKPGVPYRLKTYSMDQPGIVYRVATVLRRYGVNIEELETRVESGAFIGAPLFIMAVRLSVPSGVQVRELRASLSEVCDAFNCDMDLEPA